MIIYHQSNVAAFAGNHVWYWPTQPLVQLHTRVGAPSAAGDDLVVQARSVRRFVQGRIFGRVN